MTVGRLKPPPNQHLHWTRRKGCPLAEGNVDRALAEAAAGAPVRRRPFGRRARLGKGNFLAQAPEIWVVISACLVTVAGCRPYQLTRADIANRLDEIADMSRSCATHVQGRQLLAMNIAIQPDGSAGYTVDRGRVDEGFEPCIREALAPIRYPRFRGPAMSVTVPLKLSNDAQLAATAAEIDASLARGDYEAAGRSAAALLVLDPQHPSAWYARGRIACERRDRAELQRALDILNGEARLRLRASCGVGWEAALGGGETGARGETK